MRSGRTSWCRDCFVVNEKERGLKRRKSDKIGRPPKQIIKGELTCGTCKLSKLVGEFAKEAATPTGYRSRCRTCDSIAAQEFYKQNRKKRLANTKRWRKANAAYYTVWKRNAERERKQRNVGYRIACQLRAHLSNAVRRRLNGKIGARKGASAVRDLGCTIIELMVWLEARFTPGMTWDNYGEWHIDHVRPLASFDLTDVEQCKAACHYSNLQPLRARDNMAKGDRFPFPL